MMSSSRRKQSNPKPLKLEDESWNEAEDGDGKSNSKAKSKPVKIKEESSESNTVKEDDDSEMITDTVDGNNTEHKNVNHNNRETNNNDEDDESRQSFHSSNRSNSKSSSVSPDPPSVHQISGRHSRRTSKSSSYSNNDEAMANNFVADLKKQIPISNLDMIDPLLYNNAQQLIQAGLPYFHLLPPAMRNDAARLLLLQSNIPNEILPPPAPGSETGNTTSNPTSASVPTLSNNNNTKLDKADNSRGLMYICEPCGIKFSSARTLEAHQTYYCASRKEQIDKDVPGDKTGISSPDSKENPTTVGIKRERENTNSPNDDIEPGMLSIDENPTTTTAAGDNGDISSKNLKTGKLYSCQHCSYSADKKVSLNRHMRIHSGGTTAGNTTASVNHHEENHNSSCSPGVNGSIRNTNSNVRCNTPGEPGIGIGGLTAADRYCFECEIQFSSLKTFKVHKQYYCSTRHVLKAQPQPPVPPTSNSAKNTEGSSGLSPSHRDRSVTPGRGAGASDPSDAGSPIPEGSSLPSTPGPHQQTQQPFVVLPTNPIMIVPYCFIQGASLVPGSLVPNQNALIVLPNGSVQCLPGTNLGMGMSMTMPMVPLPVPSPFGHSQPNVSQGAPNNQSPTNTNTVFNDPKEVIRRIRPKSNSGNSGLSPIRGERNNSSDCDSGLEEKDTTEDNLPAIDLTLKTTTKKTNVEVEEEDEKENLHLIHHTRAFTPQMIQNHQSEPTSQSQMMMISPSVGSNGSGSSAGRNHHHNKRPSSTASSGTTNSTNSYSCCPSPPGTESPQSTRVNGMKCIPNSTMTIRQVPVPGKHNTGRGGSGTGNKMSPIATQLPGGAILTSTSSPSFPNPSTLPNQSLAELLMSNPNPESLSSLNLNENLLKLLPLQTSSAELLASLPRELAMTYLASLQHSFQVQQQQQNQKQNMSPSAPPPPPAVPVPHLMKRGIWKCVDCEIVYYKHENYLVHKEQYCAFRNKGREGIGSEDEMTMSLKGQQGQVKSTNTSTTTPLSPKKATSGSGSTSASPSPSISIGGGGCVEMNNSSSCSPSPQRRSSHSPDTTIENREDSSSSNSKSGISTLPNGTLEITSAPITLILADSTKHFCQKCGVGFKTLDNLQAHQAFYCRSTTNSSSTPLPVENNNVPSTAPTTTTSGNGFGQCTTCKLSIPDEQMGLHRNLCNGQAYSTSNSSSSSAPSPTGWKCPCCDTYSPTMAAAQKHLETHTGIRAFKCLICGYRGNTLRGMRTHIRMHFDKRVSGDLQEGDYISCITSTDLDAAGVGGTRNGGTGVGNGALTNTRRRNRGVTLLG